MARRSYANDRYRPEAKVGSTRKSASKAKPVRKQGEVASSVKPKAKKGPDTDWSGLPTSPEIKKWRRIWWGLLLGGLAIIGLSYAVPGARANTGVQSAVLGIVLAMSGAAVYIDLRIIRKLRMQLMEKPASKKQAAHAAKGDGGGDS